MLEISLLTLEGLCGSLGEQDVCVVFSPQIFHCLNTMLVLTIRIRCVREGSVIGNTIKFCRNS